MWNYGRQKNESRIIPIHSTGLGVAIVLSSLWFVIGLSSAKAADPPAPSPAAEEQKGSPPEGGEVQERAVPGAPVLPGRSPARPDLIVASLEKDLDLLEQEVLSAQARLAQSGGKAPEVASASFAKLDALTRSISGKAARPQQLYSQANDQRRLGVATSLKASADQMTQMVAASVVQSRSVKKQEHFLTDMLSNLIKTKTEVGTTIARNLR